MNREDFNKLQSETQETMKKEIREKEKTTEDMKEEFNKDMEKPQKKRIKQKPWNKMCLKSNKKYRRKPP
jgi:hypothetical protein